MTELVLDASVVLKWFRQAGERNFEAARALRSAFEAGRAVFLAPSLLFIEILNVAGRRWRLSSADLADLAATLPALGFEIVEPALARVADWVARGLTAYDAAYVAVAEQAGVPLVTDDTEILRLAPHVTRSLG